MLQMLQCEQVCRCVGGATSRLQLVVVRLAAAVRFLGRVFVGVKQEADAAVKSRLHMFDTCGQTEPAVNLKL